MATAEATRDPDRPAVAAPDMDDPAERYDIYTRFARRHLHTDVQQAVYLTLVSQVAESWSAAEIANRTGMPEHAVRQVLDGYTAAGIVRPAGAGRHQWRSDLSYLPGAAHGQGGWTDPVCGMPVTEDSPYRASAPNRGSHRFCCATCLIIFQACPDAYTTSTKEGRLRPTQVPSLNTW